MLSMGSLMGVGMFLAWYTVMLFTIIPEMRDKVKMGLYTIVFICLFFPDIEYLELPFGLTLNIQLYAIMLCGMELIEKWTKYILKKKSRKGKLSKKMKILYESL